jgi:hypothetical protein
MRIGPVPTTVFEPNGAEAVIRRLLNLVTVLSLLLCVGLAALWVRSYYVSDWVSRTLLFVVNGPNATEWSGFAANGHVRLSRKSYKWRGEVSPLLETNSHVWTWERHPPAPAGRFDSAFRTLMGFDFDWSTDYDSGLGFTISYSSVAFPLCLPAVLFALLPTVRLYRRIRRHPQGHCPTCGYDLRATPGKCPECGVSAGAA